MKNKRSCILTVTSRTQNILSFKYIYDRHGFRAGYRQYYWKERCSAKHCKLLSRDLYIFLFNTIFHYWHKQGRSFVFALTTSTTSNTRMNQQLENR
jgi:hypothetical protein